MILRTIAFFATASLAIACSSETATSQDPPGNQGSGSTAGTGSEDATVYSVSCHGEVAKPASTSLAIASDDIDPTCVGGAPGTKCGGDSDPCAAFDVKFHYAPPAQRCLGTDVFIWNGSDCVAQHTQGEGGQLKCVGKDCERLFKEKDACLSFALECRSK